jgi:hypothetical protein
MASPTMYQFPVTQQAYMSMPPRHHYPAEQEQVHEGSMSSLKTRWGGVSEIEKQQFGAAERHFDSFLWARNGLHTCSDVVAQGGRTDVGVHSSSNSACMNPTIAIHKSAPSVNAAYYEAERHPSKFRSGRDSLHNVGMTLADDSISTNLLGASSVNAHHCGGESCVHDRDLSMYNVSAENTALPPSLNAGFFAPLNNYNSSLQGCTMDGKQNTSMCSLGLL